MTSSLVPKSLIFAYNKKPILLENVASYFLFFFTFSLILYYSQSKTYHFFSLLPLYGILNIHHLNYYWLYFNKWLTDWLSSWKGLMPITLIICAQQTHLLALFIIYRVYLYIYNCKFLCMFLLLVCLEVYCRQNRAYRSADFSIHIISRYRAELSIKIAKGTDTTMTEWVLSNQSINRNSV